MNFRVDPKDKKGRGKSHQQEVSLAPDKGILWETKSYHREGMEKASKAGLEKLEVSDPRSSCPEV